MNIKTKKNLIRLAMRAAQTAADEGNYPFGAVLADLNGNVVAIAHNTQETDRDPTAHAEINLIRKLAKEYKMEEFSQFYMVSNAESCSMCFSAAIKVGIVDYIFGAPSETHMEPFLTVADVARYCRSSLNISYGVLEEECRHQIAEIRASHNKFVQ